MSSLDSIMGRRGIFLIHMMVDMICDMTEALVVGRVVPGLWMKENSIRHHCLLGKQYV